MPEIFGKLELFHEQGMEGNALPVIWDASKYTLNKFGNKSGKAYDGLTILESGMHLTVYATKMYDWALEIEESGKTLPRYFDKELEIIDYQKEMYFPNNPDNKWHISIKHDASFPTDEDHLWAYKKHIGSFYKNYEIKDIPHQPCHNIQGVHYQQDNPLATFFSDLDEYKEYVVSEGKTMGLMFDLTKKSESDEEILAWYDWDMYRFLPAYNTWDWMFQSCFDAKLEY